MTATKLDITEIMRRAVVKVLPTFIGKHIVAVELVKALEDAGYTIKPKQPLRPKR